MNTTPSPKLAIELFPRKVWATNLRAFLMPDKWRRLKEITLDNAGHKCEACGSLGKALGRKRVADVIRYRLETHETWAWDFNAATGIQTLVGNRALCPDCHEAVHLGPAHLKGRAGAARQHMAAVNGWTLEQVEEYKAAVWLRCEAMNQVQNWAVDIEVLRDVDMVAYKAGRWFLDVIENPRKVQGTPSRFMPEFWNQNS